MSEREMRFRIGLFVLAALVILAILSMVFSSFPTLLRRHDAYTILFDKAPGVGPGTPVRRSGVKIGEVQSVRLNDDTGKVYAEILVERPHKLMRNEEPRVGHGLLGGDTVIDFVPKNEGAEDRTPVPPGAELRGVPMPDTMTLLNQTSELVPTAQDALNDIRKSMQRYERMAPQVEETLREYRDLAKSTRETIPELRQTNQEILATSRNWGRLGERLDVLTQTNEDKVVKAIDNINDTVTRVGRVFNDENQRLVNGTLKNLKSGTENFEGLSRSTEQTINHLDQVTQELNRVLAETRDVLRVLNSEQGTFRRVFSDPALYNNLNDAACMLTRILPRIDYMLRDMQVFADKIARHPESLGLGGVVRPSAGLKESPFGRPP
jgi:phospholipid/cholesterol/gamma-HCH transport system substrate-binding protein